VGQSARPDNAPRSYPVSLLIYLCATRRVGPKIVIGVTVGRRVGSFDVAGLVFASAFWSLREQGLLVLQVQQGGAGSRCQCAAAVM
jgi:hypothetical protein